MTAISFGTSCMNRLNHLKQTYVYNIKLALSVLPESKFVLLNYNSQDGMHEWVKRDLQTYIDAGIVLYLKTDKPKCFSQSHTKNITSLHSSCIINCFLDADNFLSQDYLAKNIDFFKSSTTDHKISRPRPFNGKGGRIMCLKKDFIEIGGMDESMTGWGYEDCDFVRRFENYFEEHQKLCCKVKKEHIIQHHSEDEKTELLIQQQKNIAISNDTYEKYKTNRDTAMLRVNQGKEWGKL